MDKQTFLKYFDHIPAQFPAQAKARALLHNGLDFPTTRNEKWKYTRVAPLLARSYRVTDDVHPDVKLPGTHNPRIVLINGTFSESHSSNLPKGVECTSFTQASQEQKNRIVERLAKLSGSDGEAFPALNTAYFKDGLYLAVPDGFITGDTVEICHITNGADSAVNLRMMIVLGANSSVKFSLRLLGIDAQDSFTNATTEIFVGANAATELNLIEAMGNDADLITATYVHQEKASRFRVNTVTKTGRLVRNNVYLAIDGEGCEADMYGLYLTDGKQHVDNQTFADHRKPNSRSNELYKGIMGGESTGVFNGKIMVHRNAQLTNAFQSNQNILLGKRATINTKPELEIYADDVKCSHGCTVGQLDSEALFYLRSRGLDEKQAKRLLIRAFAAEVIDAISDEALKSECESFIQDRFQ
ncbi:MAG: Fe-S cluster assembly protein SufD [Salibacteraceae bacterium]